MLPRPSPARPALFALRAPRTASALLLRHALPRASQPRRRYLGGGGPAAPAPPRPEAAAPELGHARHAKAAAPAAAGGGEGGADGYPAKASFRLQAEDFVNRRVLSHLRAGHAPAAYALFGAMERLGLEAAPEVQVGVLSVAPPDHVRPLFARACARDPSLAGAAVLAAVHSLGARERLAEARAFLEEHGAAVTLRERFGRQLLSFWLSFNRTREALDVYRRMETARVLDNAAREEMITACARNNMVAEAEALLAEARQAPLGPTRTMFHAVVTLLLRASRVPDALPLIAEAAPLQAAGEGRVGAAFMELVDAAWRTGSWARHRDEILQGCTRRQAAQALAHFANLELPRAQVAALRADVAQAAGLSPAEVLVATTTAAQAPGRRSPSTSAPPTASAPPASATVPPSTAGRAS